MLFIVVTDTQEGDYLEAFAATLCANKRGTGGLKEAKAKNRTKAKINKNKHLKVETHLHREEPGMIPHSPPPPPRDLVTIIP